MLARVLNVEESGGAFPRRGVSSRGHEDTEHEDELACLSNPPIGLPFSASAIVFVNVLNRRLRRNEQIQYAAATQKRNAMHKVRIEGENYGGSGRDDDDRVEVRW